LYNITTHDDDKPRNGVIDIKFHFPAYPSPSVKERTYLLKVALYEGIVLPDFDEFSIYVTCGPYETKSKVVKLENSRAVWNQFLPDLLIRAPEN
jgi:hypothetical protein